MTDDRPTSLRRKAFLEKLQMIISQQPIIKSTSGLVLGWGNWGRPL